MINKTEIFMTSLSSVFYHKPLIFLSPLSTNGILSQKQKQETEKNIPGFPEVTVVESNLMGRYDTI